MIRNSPIKEVKKGLREMHIPIFPTIIFSRLHGLKYDEYLGKTTQSLEKSLFEEHKFEKRNC